MYVRRRIGKFYDRIERSNRLVSLESLLECIQNISEKNRGSHLFAIKL